MKTMLATMPATAMRAATGPNSAFRTAIAESGAFRMETIRSISSTEAYTRAIQKQDVSIGNAIKNRKLFNNILKEQYQLQRMTAVGLTEDGRGRMTAEAIVPRGTPAHLNSTRAAFNAARAGAIGFSEAADIARMRVGLLSTVLRANSNHMINWGKNTQWAGRQLMVGMTMPFAIFAGAAAAAAYSVDKEMTRVVKVYDSAGSSIIKTDAQVRTSSAATANQMARNYGQSATDTLKIMGDLASAGFKDMELQRAAKEVSRARFLGELDLQEAIKATITLQTVYGQSSEDLTKTFAMMNAVENNTVLTMQDFVTILPRVGGIIKELGGGVGDVAILGTAMKAAGIDAAEGANALKSISFRAVAANGKALETFFKYTGQHLDEIIAKNEGKVVPSLVAMMKAMEPLDKMQRVTAVRDVFGIYQGSKALSIMNQLVGETEQVSRAMEEVGRSSEEHMQAATDEVQKFQESASGKFKRALETIKAEMAELGKPLLEVATTLLGFVTSAVSWFNGLSDGTKQVILMTAAIVALVGPFIMIIGILGNFMGNILKLGATIGTLLTRFKLLSADQRLQQMLANQTALGWRDEAAAAAVLSTQLQRLTAQMQQLALYSTGARAMGITGFGNAPLGGPLPTSPAGQYGTAVPILRQNASGQHIRANGQFASRSEIAAFRAAQQSSTVIAQNAAATEGRWSRIGQHATGLAIGGALMGSMVTSSGSLMNNMLNIVMIAAMVGPTLAAGVAKAAVAIKGTAMWGSMAAGAGGLFARPLAAAKSGLGKFGTTIKALLPAIMGVGAALAIVGAGVAFTLIQINKEMEETKRKTKAVNESAKAWGETLGFDYQEVAENASKAQSALTALDAKVKKFSETNKDAAADISEFSKKGANDQWARAIEEGLKVRLHGGGEAAAKEATRTALAIMGERFKDKEFEFELKARIDFSDMKEVIKRQVEESTKVLQSASQNKFKQSKGESFIRFWTGDEDLNTKSGEEARGAAKELWNIYGQASVEEQDIVFEEIKKNSEKNILENIKNMNEKHKNVLNERGLGDIEALMKHTKGGTINLLPFEISEEEGKALMTQLQTYKIILQEKGKILGMSEKELANLHTLSQLQDRIKPGLGSKKAEAEEIKKAAYEYGQTIQWMMRSGQKLDETERLRILNLARMKVGLDAATHSEQLFEKAIKDTGDAMASDAYKVDQVIANAEEWADARQNIMQNTMNDAFSFADEIMQSQQQSEIDAIGRQGAAALKGLENASEAQDSRFDAKRKAFDKKWDATMDAFDKRWEVRKEREKAFYDNRIEGIQKAMEAEQMAEEQRQKMFEAEKTRIQRLSDLYSKNIDFNVALSGGKLDEAAKIGNDIQSTQDSWLVDDAAAVSEEASAAKRRGMEDQIKKIETAREARMRILDETEEREKKALEDKKEREQEALDAERRRWQKGQEAAREALQNQTKMAEESARRRLEAAKRAMDLELAALKEFIPRDEAEMKTHIKNIETVYAKYGVNLKINGNEWGKYVGQALQSHVNKSAMEMRTKVAWGQIAAGIAQEMASGAFGMDMTQFMEWVRTGKLPEKPTAGGPGAKQDRNYGSTGRMQLRHKGGIIGLGGVNSREGYSGSKAHSEVDLRARVGEYVMSNSAVNRYGADFMDKINNGKVAMDSNSGQGGPQLGLTGMMMAGFAGMMRNAISNQIISAGSQQLTEGPMSISPGAPGKYGNVKLNASQLANAAKIMSVGKSMGASSRDLVIALMTAMQESTLRNIAHGDRDSVGLFQQRPSQGWGTIAQIMNPAYAARKFFEKLLRIKNRDSMEPTLAANAVQISAFPRAYANWEAMARAIVNGTASGISGPMMIPGGKGYIRPMRTGRVTSEYGRRTDPFTGATSYHDGIDIAAPGGTPIYASQSGIVSQAAWDGGYGNRTIINHPDGRQTGYAHQSRMHAGRGSQVKQGQLIGYVGTTGRSTGTHLHFQVGKKFAWLNPRSFVPGLAKGGYTLNDGYAKLHKSETVMTKPLTEKFHKGVDNFAKGGGSEYNVEVNIHGNVSSEVDLERAIRNGIEKARREEASRVGFKRSIG